MSTVTVKWGNSMWEETLMSINLWIWLYQTGITVSTVTY